MVDEGEAEGCGRWGAIVADVCDSASGASRLHFCRPTDVAAVDDETSELQPLGFDDGGGEPLANPRRLRVFHRAKDYWLCLFMADFAGVARHFWGEIEWREGGEGAGVEVPVLRALRQVGGARGLAQAHAIVGLL